MAWSRADAVAYAKHHIDTWNTHALDDILDLYAEDAELTSPLAASITGSEVVSGRAALRAYFVRGFDTYPDLNFEILDVLRGSDGITILMLGAGGKTVAEVLLVNQDNKVQRVAAHYSCAAE